LIHRASHGANQIEPFLGSDLSARAGKRVLQIAQMNQKANSELSKDQLEGCPADCADERRKKNIPQE